MGVGSSKELGLGGDTGKRYNPEKDGRGITKGDGVGEHIRICTN